ncbi:MAG: hypothetical protein ACR2M3_14010 [Thermomicrobiales bacterium]
MDEGPLLRYRCRVGHAYTADSLMSEQTLHFEAALWAALRGLEEKAALVYRLADRARAAGHGILADRYAEQGRDAQQHEAVIRTLILRGETSPPAPSPSQWRGGAIFERSGHEEERLGIATSHPFPSREGAGG